MNAIITIYLSTEYHRPKINGDIEPKDLWFPDDKQLLKLAGNDCTPITMLVFTFD